MQVETNPKIKNIITSYFQNVDLEVSEYIHNVLDEGRKGDFTNPNDIFECLGKFCKLKSPNKKIALLITHSG